MGRSDERIEAFRILDRVDIGHRESVLHIEVGGERADLHAIWLRDVCRCEHCRRPTTNERLLDSATIPLDITIDDAHRVDDDLAVHLSDGHRALISLEWLVDHLRSIDFHDRPADRVEIATGSVPAGIRSFDRRELDSADGLRRWLDAVLRNGTAVVHGVSPDEAGLREVAALVGEIRATNYGVVWAIEAEIAPVSAVESERHLLVHTDLPYRDGPPGVQLLLASVVDVDGGASTLVDGFAAGERLRHVDPAAWDLLSSVEFSYPFVRSDVEFHGRAPIIGLRPDGRYHQVRRAPDLVGVPYISDPAGVPDLYRAMRAWNSLVDDPAHELVVELRPGDLLAFDNHRMLHGRTAFDLGAHGRRRLLGCYLDVEDVRSRRAVLGRLY